MIDCLCSWTTPTRVTVKECHPSSDKDPQLVHVMDDSTTSESVLFNHLDRIAPRQLIPNRLDSSPIIASVTKTDLNLNRWSTITYRLGWKKRPNCGRTDRPRPRLHYRSWNVFSYWNQSNRPDWSWPILFLRPNSLCPIEDCSTMAQRGVVDRSAKTVDEDPGHRPDRSFRS